METNHSEIGDAVPASSLKLAREAYLDGEIATCLVHLDHIFDAPAAEQREALLLRARALLREHHADAVVQLLGPALTKFVGVDEACTARMLHAVAVCRSGSPERGLTLLQELRGAARALHAHATIEAEILYWSAFAHWIQREFSPCLRFAYAAEAARADIVSVRAASLRGFVAVAKERYPQALALFRSALRAYDSCRERDTDLVERIAAQIASLELTLRSAHEQGTHALPYDAGRLPSSYHAPPPGPGTFRMATSAMDAWLFAFDGDRTSAYRKMRIADTSAPTPAWRVWALANRANLTLAFGDVDAGTEFAAHALEIADTVDWDTTSDEERVALLFLAEALSVSDTAAAMRTLQRYDAITTPIDRSLLFRSDVRLWLLERFVHGLVLRIQGDLRAASQAFADAFGAASRIGNLWRAALALIELDATPAPVKPRGEFSLEHAAQLVREHFPRSFLALRLGRWMAAAHDPVIAGLARVPREVLRHLLDGRSQKEIASAMGLAPGTVKNYVNGLHRSFGVGSTPQLLVACYRRGLGTPSWSTDVRRRAARASAIEPDRSSTTR